MAPSPPLDRFLQAVALAGGAALGYLTMLDWVGHWFHRPLMRFPWMLAGALTVWAAYVAMGRDRTISGPTRRAFWWGLLGLLGGYGIQLLYLLTRQGWVQPRLLLPVGTLWEATKAAINGRGAEGLQVVGGELLTPALPAIW
ncbi:MAG TPA: hypothetical protein VEI97_08560, partial [bacterium]|nr:hypothetical protein [bacterium]